MIFQAFLVLIVAVLLFQLPPSSFRFGSLSFSLSFPVIKISSENVEPLLKRLPSRYLHPWFLAGVAVTLFVVPASAVLLASNLAFHVKKSYIRLTSVIDKVTEDDSMLKVVVPGYNLPLSDVGYYLAALIVSSAFHELGHALASFAEKISCLEGGIMIYVVVPVAYVNISTRELDGASKLQKLKIFTGGVWHNLSLSALALVILKAVPFLMMPMFAYQNGVMVTDVNAGLAGPSGLQAGDVIRKINNCSVGSLTEYGDCISKVLHKADNDRWCVKSGNKRFVKDLKNCCGAKVNASDLCFAFTSGKEKAFSCLSVRRELENGGGFCGGSGTDDCPVGYSCMEPMLESWEKLVQVQRLDDKDFLYIGNPADIYNHLEVSEYIWRLGNVSWISSMPRRVERLLYFIVIVSSALGVLNAIPCWRLDGQHIVSASLESFSSRHKLVRVVTHFGTALLALNLAFGLLDIL